MPKDGIVYPLMILNVNTYANVILELTFLYAQMKALLVLMGVY